jgi:3-deoxy-D-manno-octulosonic-acid transferase
VILVDTIGELSDVWGLADPAFVGRSLDGRRGGQNMIELTAYGPARLKLPRSGRQPGGRRRCAAGGGCGRAGKRDAPAVADPVRRHGMGLAGQHFVQQQGATEQTVRWLGRSGRAR